jgi:hypothetical protein
MNRIRLHIIAVFMSVVLLFGTSSLVLAEVELPEGTVAGLPESLTIMDDQGNSANRGNGEYYLEISDMEPGTTYTKKIQIMNLREDKAYHIYMYAEPVDKSGDLDLENNTTEKLSLDGEQLYSGLVTGKGNVNLVDTPLDLGLYEPGQSRALTCQLVWNGDTSDVEVDYGSRLVDTHGTHVVRPGSDGYESYGDVSFKWVFYAVIDTDYVPPKTGILGGLSILQIGIIITLTLLICLMIFLIIGKKKRENNGRQGTKKA